MIAKNRIWGTNDLLKIYEYLVKIGHITQDCLSDDVKVLHVWNTAEVGGLLSRYMDRFYLNINSKCIMYEPRDRFKFANEKVQLIRGSKYFFHLKCLFECRKYDILHFHAMDRFLRIYKNVYPDKKIIMHYHGSNIRNRWEERRKYWRHADYILVSTPDLLEGSPDRAIYIPNPVNEELCLQNSERVKLPNTGFHVDRFASDIAQEYANFREILLEIFDRDRDPKSHFDFIRYLSIHEFYIDVKRDTPTKSYVLRAMSKTGLEALKCGCKVINFDGEIIDEFPPKHLSQNICSKLIRIYQDDDHF